MPNHHHAVPIEAGNAADNGVVVGIMAIAVQLLKIGAQRIDVVLGVGALRMARDLRDLRGGELGEDGFGQISGFFLQTFDFIGNIYGRIALHKAQFFNFVVQLGDGLFKI